MKNKTKAILKKTIATLVLAMIWGMGPATLGAGVVKHIKSADVDKLEARLAPTYKEQMIDFNKELNDIMWWEPGLKLVRENPEDYAKRIAELSKAESDPTVNDKDFENYKTKIKDRDTAKSCFYAGGLITFFSGLYTGVSPTSKNLCKYIKGKEL